MERWLSGRKRRFAKPMKEYSFRRFESCLLRCYPDLLKSGFFVYYLNKIGGVVVLIPDTSVNSISRAVGSISVFRFL